MTHMSDLLNGVLDGLRTKLGRGELAILETGTIRQESEEYRWNDGWSTLTFAENVRDHGGSLTSIDLDVAAADRVLTRHGLRDHVTLIEGDSIRTLQEMQGSSFDLVLLDSDNDADLIMNEYHLVKPMVNTPGVIIVDDVVPGSPHVVKGHKLVPYLDSSLLPYRMETRTGRGYSTGMLIMDV